MEKIGVIVFADTDTHADLARVVNAMMTVREFKEGGDEVRLIFDGAGTKWIGELSKPDNRSHALFESVKDKIAGVCSFCAQAFGVKQEVEAAGIPLLEEYRRHPSIRKLVLDGYQVLLFALAWTVTPLVAGLVAASGFALIRSSSALLALLSA